MEIKLPHLPFRFDSSAGPMEVTVRRGPAPDKLPFVAGLSFLQAGPRALERIPLLVRSESYGGALQALLKGFKVNLAAHEEHSVEFLALTALCHARGVIDLDMEADGGLV